MNFLSPNLRKIVIIFKICIIVGFASISQPSIASPKQTRFSSVIIASGSTSGLYYKTAAHICEVLKKEGVRNCSVRVTGGSQENIQALEKNEVTFALVQENYTGRLNAKQLVKSLYNEYIVFVSAKKYVSGTLPELLAGSYYAPSNSGINNVLSDISKSLTEFPILKTQIGNKTAQEEIQQVCDNALQFKLFVLGIPSNEIYELKMLCNLHIYSFSEQEISQIISKNPLYSKNTIDGSIYGLSESLQTLSLRVLLVANHRNSRALNEFVLEALHKHDAHLKHTLKHLSF